LSPHNRTSRGWRTGPRCGALRSEGSGQGHPPPDGRKDPGGGTATEHNPVDANRHSEDYGAWIRGGSVVALPLHPLGRYTHTGVVACPTPPSYERFAAPNTVSAEMEDKLM